MLVCVVPEGVTSLLWWSAWESDANAVCQWLAKRYHRQASHTVLEEKSEASQGVVDKLVKVLRAGCVSVAGWRWQTIANVVVGLARFRPAEVDTVSFITDYRHIISKEASLANHILAAVRPARVRACVVYVERLARPVIRQSSWAKGGLSHVAEHMASAQPGVGAFMCLWKGCRAPELRGRVLQGANEICELRAWFIVNAAGATGPLVSAATRMLAKLDLKLSWVNESPIHSLATGQPGQRSCISRGL